MTSNEAVVAYFKFLTKRHPR